MQCIRNAHLLERLGCFIRILDEFPLLIEARFLLRQHGQQDVSPRLDSACCLTSLTKSHLCVHHHGFR